MFRERGILSEHNVFLMSRFLFGSILFLSVAASASSKDTLMGSEMHTNIPLTKGGEFVRPSTSTGVLVDSVSFGAQQDDISWGRNRDSPAILAFFGTPTPGSRKGQASPGISSTQTTALRVSAFGTGKVPSNVVTHTYFINEPVKRSVFSMVTDPDELFTDPNGI